MDRVGKCGETCSECAAEETRSVTAMRTRASGHVRWWRNNSVPPAYTSKDDTAIFANCRAGNQTESVDGSRFYFPDSDNFPQDPKPEELEEIGEWNQTDGFRSLLDSEDLPQDPKPRELGEIQEQPTPEIKLEPEPASGEHSSKNGNLENLVTVMVVVSSCLVLLVIVLVMALVGMRIRKKRKKSRVVEADVNGYYFNFLGRAEVTDRNPEYVHYKRQAEVRDNNIYYGED